MKLIVGLGNPGKNYERTRHNMGFLVIDALANKWQNVSFKEDFKAEIAIVKSKQVMLLKPTTFMNLSGEAVRLVIDYYKLDIQDIVIIYDDLALSPGSIRLRLSGSSGSHNGMQSVIDHCQTDQIKRVRIGIGAVPIGQQGKDYVLTTPNKPEFDTLTKSIQEAALAIEDYLHSNDFLHAMNRFNRGGTD
jgi:peptidyl-tRNA hydrolase, PTH1 family